MASVLTETFLTSDGRGYGVRVCQDIPRGRFLCRYRGELLQGTHWIKQREEEFEARGETTSFLFLFRHKDLAHAIDATHTLSQGRYINHSRKKANVKPKVVEVDGEPQIHFFSARDLKAGEELLFDYGDRRTHIVKAFDWLKK